MYKMDLKIMQYIKKKPFNQKYKTTCFFCKQDTQCYVSNHYYSDIFVPLSICIDAYQELSEFPTQMILIDTLLSLNLVNDVKKLIQLLIYKTKSSSKCSI